MICLGKGVSCSTFCNARVNILALALLAFHVFGITRCPIQQSSSWTHSHTHTYPVSGVSSHRYGNPCVLADWPFVSDCRCRPFLHLRGFAEQRERGGSMRNKQTENLKNLKITTVCLNEAPEMIWSTSFLFFFSALLAAEEDKRRRAGDTQSANVMSPDSD